ncbi:MAG TPA: glutamine--tRNA ligase/YqeY domain fusion protein [Acholeplasmataceae bacterium]|nr:glutamine--tRNA ligase/YqeY domain fusion protein [Acholeplasmataceae bacterium]
MEEISNFIKTIMQKDLETGRVSEIVTRFPPEPNAYLHIGHARALVTNFELAKHFNGRTNLRFDDTNPAKEDVEFVEAIIKDIEWLGYKPDKILFGSDYFEESYQYAVKLIKKGLAYVCDLSQEEIREYRGTLTEPGRNSPYRNRSVEENLELFENMRNGVYKEGEKVLRAKIDMSHPNLNMRDPVIYRIMYVEHHRQGTKWCIFPMYDFAHPLQDAIEGITHSLCSLEYENHRILYDWFIEHCETPHVPQQIEFGRLNITNTIMSKRYLRQLVEKGLVEGYDDPRMPTLIGLRRRGYTPEAIKNFILATGLSRINSTVESDMLEHFLREDLKLKAKRLMAVIEPLKVIITNYPEDEVEYLDAVNNVENPELGTRKVAFSRNLYIDRNDFVLQKPNKHYKRLALGIEVRLFNAYFIKAYDVKYDSEGNIEAVLCTYDPETKSGSGFNARKPNGTIHFVEATTARPATFNLFEPLIYDSEVDKDNFIERLNPNSWIQKAGYIENAQERFEEPEKFQFIREGYFTVDKTSTDEQLVFNRIVPLKSSVK